MKDRKEQIMFMLAMWGVFAPVALILYILLSGKDVTPLMAGFIGVIVGTYPSIYNYYFGSSSGSKTKQETIDKMATAVVPETIEQQKARHLASGSELSFEEWIKLPDNEKPKQ